MGKLLRFLVLACVVQVAGAQGLFKGFVPDENGTNLDEPQATKTIQQKVSPGTIIKDCPECPEMLVLPGGSFLMGMPPDPEPNFADEKPQHLVQIQSFAIGKYEVTQEHWVAVMGNNPSYNKGLALPVEQISWDDIQQFIVKMNQKTGRRYRLPSEAEWEYAARAGSTTEWSFGSDESKLGSYAWYDKNSGGKTRAVGQKLPNAFGLFDMHGNVWEWVQDCWHDTYAGAPTDGSAWITGCYSNSRLVRGGSFNAGPMHLRSTDRNRISADIRGASGSFRLALDL